MSSTDPLLNMVGRQHINIRNSIKKHLPKNVLDAARDAGRLKLLTNDPSKLSQQGKKAVLKMIDEAAREGPIARKKLEREFIKQFDTELKRTCKTIVSLHVNHDGTKNDAAKKRAVLNHFRMKYKPQIGLLNGLTPLNPLTYNATTDGGIIWRQEVAAVLKLSIIEYLKQLRAMRFVCQLQSTRGPELKVRERRTFEHALRVLEHVPNTELRRIAGPELKVREGRTFQHALRVLEHLPNTELRRIAGI